MRPKFFLPILAAVLLAGSAQAQYTGNNQTNTISGFAVDWTGNGAYIVGDTWVYDALLIQNGGVLSNTVGYIGNQPGADDNTALVSGTGSVWSNINNLSVGYYGTGNSLTITNGGAVYNAYGVIGYQSGADDNTVLVSGSSSVWESAANLFLGYQSSGNILTIANGGTANDIDGVLSGSNTSSNNAVLVTDSGSVWSNSDVLYVGEYGPGNSLTISNGGYVLCDGPGAISVFNSSSNTVLVTGSGSAWNANEVIVGYLGSGSLLTITNGGAVYAGLYGAYVGFEIGASNNTVVVSGNGAAWIDSGELDIGDSESGNQLVIGAGGSVLATNVVISNFSLNLDNTPSNNVIQVNGGSLIVANAGNGQLIVSQAGGTGSLILNSGSVTVDQLVLANGGNSLFTFNAGTLTSSGTFVTNNQVFVVGDGTDAATFQLNGGIHSFANNLEIANNATLTGCGTINGDVTIDPGGTVVSDCGGTLTFNGSVTNNGTMLAVNGSVLEAYGTVVNNGVINIINGSTNFLGGLVNNGEVLTEADVQISSATRSGNNIIIQIQSVTGAAYQLQVTPTLNPAAWANLGASQDGTGSVLTFTDTGGATNRPSRFYRLDITAQAPAISFAGNGAGWQVNSSGIATAPFTGDVLTLTDNNNSEARSAWYTIQQSILAPGFTASFTYQASGNEQADGVTFTVQNSGTLALGAPGGGLGYSGITPSAAVQINIYFANGVGTSYNTNGLAVGPYTSTSPVNPASGDPINVTLVYDPIAGTLSESLQDANTPSQVYNTVYNVGDLSALLGGNNAYIGFTGGCGGLTSTQTISNFQFGASAP